MTLQVAATVRREMPPMFLGTLRACVFGMDKRETGAGEGIRTLDPNLGKVVLYP